MNERHLCKDCENCKREYYEEGYEDYLCLVNYTVNYITGELHYKDCHKLNKNGKCSKFEKKVPVKIPSWLKYVAYIVATLITAFITGFIVIKIIIKF